jgi:hypothetical protein
MTTKFRGLLSLGAELDTIGALAFGRADVGVRRPALAQSLEPLVRITPLLNPLAAAPPTIPKKQETEFGSILYKNSNPEPWVTCRSHGYAPPDRFTPDGPLV